MCVSTNTTGPPLAAISAATRWPRSTSRSAKATCAPSAMKRRTVASPIPDAPPVTAATFPLSCPIDTILLCVILELVRTLPPPKHLRIEALYQVLGTMKLSAELGCRVTGIPTAKLRLITRTDGALLLCFLLTSPRHLCYDSAPRAELLLPEHTPRSTRPANSTHRIVSWQESLFINAAAYVRT